MDEEIAVFEVEFVLVQTVEQRRSPYRPNNKHPLTGEYFLGFVDFRDGHADPGIPTTATIRTLTRTSDMAFLRSFGSWTIWEGPHHVGSVRVLREVGTDLDSPGIAGGNTD